MYGVGRCQANLCSLDCDYSIAGSVDRILLQKARYIAEKTDYVAAHLPLGYKDKVNKIAEKAGTSKAQALKAAIDALYATMFDEQPTEQE